MTVTGMELCVESAEKLDGFFAVTLFGGPRLESPLMLSQKDVIIIRKGTALSFACVWMLAPVPSEPRQ